MISGGGKLLSTCEVVADTEVTSHPTSCSHQIEKHNLGAKIGFDRGMSYD